jgi:methylase of polypeptide subunit release factors
MIWQTTGSKRIRVHHHSEMEGGGTWFGTEYAEILREKYAREWSRCYEWCAGPGFIGFDIFDHGLCNSLCLSDRHEPCIYESIPATVLDNQIDPNLVSAYHGSSLACLPMHERFDLVVANPPHYLECPGDSNYQRLAVDTDWAAHRDFFEHIGDHLDPDGMILLQENQAGSANREQEWINLIESNGLEIRAVFDSERWYYHPGPWCQIYYIEIGLAK